MTKQSSTPPGSDTGAPAGVQPGQQKSGHPQDGSQVQTVVEEQLFIETAKDDQFSGRAGAGIGYPATGTSPREQPARACAGRAGGGPGSWQLKFSSEG
jgi:hypothetical protein